jgi:uncharacterized protein YcaQ
VTLSISEADARRFLVSYQLARSDIPDVFRRLGSIQYDPLNPTGRNVDLVLQARVPRYRVDDWLKAVYRQRVAYDAWDKQACLVPVSDWPNRFPIRDQFHPWHDRTILDSHPDMVETIFAELDARGPLSSLEFEDRRQAPVAHSWLGPTIVKRVLRALWARGELVTHHRVAGRHYYDRPERVIPAEHIAARPLHDLDAYYRWIILRRHQAGGLLRPGASAEVWSVCGDRATRDAAVRALADDGSLIPVHVGVKGQLYHMPAAALPVLEDGKPKERTVFLGPLDNLIWDRKAILALFGFNYIWEVYKKPHDRTWGYYVLPVLHGDRFVGRIDSRLEGGTWKVANWWWEDGIRVTVALLSGLRRASRDFARYLGAERTEVASHIDARTREALLASA